MYAQLPDTASRKNSHVIYFSYNDPKIVADGCVSITSTVKGQEVMEDYDVQEEYPFGVNGRVFLLAKNDGTVYEVAILDNGRKHCSCKAGQVKRHTCKHVAAMSEVVKQIPCAFANPEQDY